MKFSDFYGQSSVIDELRASFGSGRVVHGFLFIGPAGAGKKTLARICAQALVCRGADKPCGKCGACIRFEQGGHPDVIELEPDRDKKSIGVDETRALIERLAVRPFEGGGRAVMIFKPMTPQAQNALLKILEEPPFGTVFFITAPSALALLPTVVSRMRTISLGPVTPEQARAALVARGIAPERADLLAGLSECIIGRAIELDANKRFWQIRDTALSTLLPTRPSEAFERIEALADMRPDADTLLGCMEQDVSDMLRVCAGARVRGADVVQKLGGHAVRIGYPGVCALMDAVSAARERINRNSTWQAVTGTLVFDIMEVYDKWQQ